MREAACKASVFARVAPAHKLRIVEAVQAQGHMVTTTGDGVTDAPAIQSADIGVAMGVTGTEATKEASKMILADDNFATIVATVREESAILDNIRKFLRYLLSSNMGEVLAAFLGIVLARALGLMDAGGTFVVPLLATQILWINLITDTSPALAMGVDPHANDVMTRPPRKPDVDADMWITASLTGITMAAVTLLTMDLLLPGGWIEGAQPLEVARKAAFTVRVLARSFQHALSRCRRRGGPFRQRLALGCCLARCLLQTLVVHAVVLNLAFGAVALSAGQWLLYLGMASTVLWVSELHKFCKRHTARSGH